VTCYEIEFPLSGLDADAVEAALLEAGACSITLVDRGDDPVLEPMPGEIRLWSDTLVRALFQAGVDTCGVHTPAVETRGGAHTPGADACGASAALCAYAAGTPVALSTHDLQSSLEPLSSLERLARRLGPHITATARVRAIQPRDWERVWLTDWKSMRFGRRLWVCPTAAAAPDDPDALVVRLDPGLAFGTGAHPTTALCLQFLDALPLAGRRVIDYGCGSGILGIAALKLGAAHVVALDLDPQALIATRDNALRNDVSSRIEVSEVPAQLQPAGCVVANILAGPLIALAPTLTAACELGGDLLLSGLLKTQAYEVKAAYSPHFDTVRVVGRDDWCCIHARRSS
jgi:ribosomal protein L11 methyltransferase